MRRAPRVAPMALALLLLSSDAGAGGPAPTPVPPDGSPSPYPQRLATPEPGRRLPPLSAESYALVDLDTHRILHHRRAEKRRPVASLTKIMTVLVALEETEQGEEVTVSVAAAAQAGSELGLVPGERIEMEELLYALMLQSSNDAAVAVAEHVAGSVPRFVRRMNRRARQLGLRDTRFASPNGLDDSGYSTAADLARISAEAFAHPAFVRIARTKLREFPAPGGAPTRMIQSRNALLWLYRGAVGVKTGFTSAAGFCLVGAAERGNRRLAAVVLGAPGEAFTDTATLLDFGFRNWRLRTLLDAGEGVDPIVVQGVEVPVAPAEPIVALLPRGLEPTLAVEVSPDLTLPIARGEPVGTVSATAGGEEVGAAPLVAAAGAVSPPTLDELVDRVARSVADTLEALLDLVL